MLKAHNIKELQSFMAMLNRLEAKGINDIRFARTRVQGAIDTHYAERRTHEYTQAKKTTTKHARYNTCPSCGGRGLMMPVINSDGLKLLGCKVCRYSEVVA